MTIEFNAFLLTLVILWSTTAIVSCIYGIVGDKEKAKFYSYLSAVPVVIYVVATLLNK